MNVSPIVPGRVSIVIPAYNCATTVAATIESCLAQTYRDVEIFVVNDGSNDRTAEVLRTFGQKITIIDKSNGGVAASRNVGTVTASGEFVVWMDHDDLMAPDRVRLQVKVLTSDPSIELVSSDFSAFTTVEADFEHSHIASYYSAVRRLGGLDRIYSQARVIEEGTVPGDQAFTVRSGQIYESLLSGNFVHPPTVMVRRSVFDRAGYFDETLTYNSEYDLVVRIARVGCVAYIDAPLLRYRRSETQLSHCPAGGKIPLETVRVLEKVRRDDPAMYASHSSLFRHRFAEQFIDAADLIGPSDRLRAFRLLIRGLRYKLLFSAALHALGRIVVPRFAVKALKRMWRNVALAFPLSFTFVEEESLFSAIEMKGFFGWAVAFY